MEKLKNYGNFTNFLAPLPSKPQAVLIERWLPYSQVKRRVIYQRANERDAVVVKPKNVIVQWEAPQVLNKSKFIVNLNNLNRAFKQ